MAQGFYVSRRRTGLAAQAIAFARSIVAVASRPANMFVVAVVLLGWTALLSWTGNGPGGWQARACAGLEAASRACAEVLPAKDPSRITPHDAGFGS